MMTPMPDGPGRSRRKMRCALFMIGFIGMLSYWRHRTAGRVSVMAAGLQKAVETIWKGSAGEKGPAMRSPFANTLNRRRLLQQAGAVALAPVLGSAHGMA